MPQIDDLNEGGWGASRQREAAPALNLGARQRLDCWSSAQKKRCGTSKPCQLTRRLTRMQSRRAIRFVSALMLFVDNDKTNLITQGTKRNASANNKVWAWLKESVVCIEALTGTQA